MASKISEFKQKIYKAKLIGLDSNIFIYEFGKHKLYFSFVHELFTLIGEGKLTAVTSLISFIEVTSFSLLKNKQRLLKSYKEIFLKTPNLKTINPNFEIAEKAASLRRNYHLRTPDAIQIATAIETQADFFISNDESLKKVKEIKILVLKDFL